MIEERTPGNGGQKHSGRPNHLQGETALNISNEVLAGGLLVIELSILDNLNVDIVWDVDKAAHPCPIVCPCLASGALCGFTPG